MYSVLYSISGKNQDFIWHLMGVYAPNNRHEREETLGKLELLGVVCRALGTLWGFLHNQTPSKKNKQGNDWLL